jgi:hypothetical protein
VVEVKGNLKGTGGSPGCREKGEESQDSETFATSVVLGLLTGGLAGFVIV